MTTKVRSKHLGRAETPMELSNWGSHWLYRCPTCNQLAESIWDSKGTWGFLCKCGTVYHVTEVVEQFDYQGDHP